MSPSTPKDAFISPGSDVDKETSSHVGPDTSGVSLMTLSDSFHKKEGTDLFRQEPKALLEVRRYR